LQKDETPLHFVASRGKREMALMLLDQGADANARNNVRSLSLSSLKIYMCEN
jgi:ankyrin repeat protein